MKTTFKAVLVLGMTILYTQSFGQSNTETQLKVRTTQSTYLVPVLKSVSTYLNYGSSNRILKDYKKQTNGIQAGVTFQAGITPDFSVASELYAVMKGGKLKANNPFNGFETTERLYALELPVLARLHIDKFYTNAGPSIAYNVYGTRKMNGVKTDLSFGNSNQDFKRFEVGIQGGVGYSFKAKRKMITLDLRYNHGITNIANTADIHNRNVMISVHVYKPWKTNPFASNRD
jgi:hypothetical protein